MWLLNYKNVKIISKIRKYDIKEDPADVILSAVDCYKGYREGRDIGERTQRGKKARFKDGLWVRGFIPEGYSSIVKWFDDGKTRKQWLTRISSTTPVIQEIVVQEIFTTYKKKSIRDTISIMGEKYQEIFHKQLNESRLKRILLDSVYIGKPTYGELIRDEKPLAIIDELLFNEVQQKLSKNKRNHTAHEIKQNVFDIVSKNFGLGFASRNFPEFVPHCICGRHMVVHDGSITKGVWVSRFICPNCNRQRTLPTGTQIDNYKNLNLLSCPYCRETEHFDYRREENIDEYIYKCRHCGGSFKSTANPDRYLRTIAANKNKIQMIDQSQQENKQKKQVRKLSLDLFT
jgi:Zn ribbon nucleic-acid-binding protein